MAKKATISTVDLSFSHLDKANMVVCLYDGHRCCWEIAEVSTSVAEGSSVSRRATVTGKAVGSLDTAPLILAEGAIAAAVAWTTHLNPGGNLSSFFQVQGDAIQLQRTNTTPKTFLPGCCASWRHRQRKDFNTWFVFSFQFQQFTICGSMLERLIEGKLQPLWILVIL